MVDQTGRAQLASALTHFVSGEVTTDSFCALHQPGISSDKALQEIWLFAVSRFHDLYPYYLKGRHSLSREDTETIERCILFLHTPLEYSWPPYPSGSCYASCFIAGTALMMTAGVLSFFQAHLLAGACLIVGALLTISAWILGGMRARKDDELFWQHGERAAWPFIDRSQHSEAEAAHIPMR